MAEAVYVLCILTSLTCAVLLVRGYLRSRSRLLLYSGICFVGLMLTNVIIFCDLILFPDLPLYAWRSPPAAAGLGILIYGLIWEMV